MKYADRLRILASSWATANKKAMVLSDGAGADGEEKEGDEEKQDAAQASFSSNDESDFRKVAEKERAKTKSTKEKKKGGGFLGMMGGNKGGKNEAMDVEGGSGEKMEGGENSFKNTSVPTTYNDMFMFNA